MTRFSKPNSAREAAEAAFKSATTKIVVSPEPKGQPPVPGAKETVSLRVDQDVLAFFQNAGPAWHERMIAALRKAAGL